MLWTTSLYTLSEDFFEKTTKRWKQLWFNHVASIYSLEVMLGRRCDKNDIFEKSVRILPKCINLHFWRLIFYFRTLWEVSETLNLLIGVDIIDFCNFTWTGKLLFSDILPKSSPFKCFCKSVQFWKMTNFGLYLHKTVSEIRILMDILMKLALYGNVNVLCLLNF